MNPVSSKKPASWRLLIPVVAALSLLVVGSVHFGTSVFAGDKVTPRTSPPGMEVSVQVAADQSVVDALADGNITPAEYAASYNRVAACLDNAGVAHQNPWYDDRPNSPRYRMSVYYPEGNEQEQEAIYNECFFKFAADIEGQWDRQHNTTAQQRAVDQDDALQCAADAGYEFENYGEFRSSIVGPDSDPDLRLVLRSCLIVGELGFNPSERHFNEPDFNPNPNQGEGTNNRP